MSVRITHLINWKLISSRRRIRDHPVLRPLLPTVVWLLITGALADLTIMGGLIFGAHVGVPALLLCLAAAVGMIRSPYRWQQWHAVRVARRPGMLGWPQ